MRIIKQEQHITQGMVRYTTTAVLSWGIKIKKEGAT